MTANRTPAPAGLPDDVLTQRPGLRSARARLGRAVDVLVGADPGLNQLRLALQGALGIGVALLLAYLFVRATGALQLPAGSVPATMLAAANQGRLLVAMLLAGTVAMQAAFVVRERTAPQQALFSILLPVPMVATLLLGLVVGRTALPSLVLLVVALTAATYLRRFGPRGLAAGNAIFFGTFLGTFLHTQFGPRDVGWIGAVLEVGVLASLFVRLAFFRPDPEAALERMRRSQRARARRLLALGLQALTEDDREHVLELRERMRRQVVRLNETTLMIDAQLAQSTPRTAAVEAQRSFDTELALTNTARFAAVLAAPDMPVPVRSCAAAALSALLSHDRLALAGAVEGLRNLPTDDDRRRVLTSRLAASAEQYARARDHLTDPISGAEVAAADDDDFTPAVQLAGDWLPGSVPVSTEASTTRGEAPLDRATMPPYLRTTLQTVVAGVLAVAVGYAVSTQRVTWAVLTVFVCFLQASNSGEQVRRALFRAGGTAVGIVVGDLLVHLTGGQVWPSVSMVLAAMFFGIYLIRVNYMFLTVAITIMISQLYVQLGEFGWGILLLRLVETAVGVGAVVVTVVLVVPLRPQRVLSTGVLLWFRALRALVEAVLGRLDGEGEPAAEPLRPLVRDLDAAYAALVSTATSLRRVTIGRTANEIPEVLEVSAAARQYARSLAASLPEAEVSGEGLPGRDDARLHAAAEQLLAALDAIEEHLTTGRPTHYTRSSSLLALALDDLRRRRSPLVNTLRDLTRLDGALARLASALGMGVTDRDTAWEQEPPFVQLP